MLTFLGAAREAVTDLLDVVADLGIFQHGPALAHLPEPSQAGLILIFERYSRIRRTAKFRQILVGHARTGRPAHAGARTHA